MPDEKGLPIGGLFSSVGSRVVLCWCENKHFEFIRSEYLRIRRYEDDLIVNGNYCRSCIVEIIERVYAHPFEEEESNWIWDKTAESYKFSEGVMIQWLDLEFGEKKNTRPDNSYEMIPVVRQFLKPDRKIRIPPFSRGDEDYAKVTA